MAISSYKVFLMKKGTGDTYTKLIDIKDFPDLGGDPEALDTTTLSNKFRTSIPGIIETDMLKFTANYTPTDYQTLQAEDDDDEHDYAVWFGGTESGGIVTPTGSNGKFSFKGKTRCYVSGAGVNEVVDMIINISLTTDITFAAG